MHGSAAAATNDADDGHWSRLWSQLHLCILETLTAFSSLPGSQHLELITLADMNQTVKDVIALAHVSRHQPGGMVSLAVERLVQILQVALATGAFRCSLGKSYLVCAYYYDMISMILHLKLLVYFCKDIVTCFFRDAV